MCFTKLQILYEKEPVNFVLAFLLYVVVNAYFSNKTIAIATKHGKEEIIFPLLQQQLGITRFILPPLDTDQFGTFSGEKEREGSPFDALRKKCDAAFALTNCSC